MVIMELYREGRWTKWIAFTREEMQQLMDAPAGANLDVLGPKAGIEADARLRITIVDSDDQARMLMMQGKAADPAFVPPAKLPRFGTEPPTS